MISPQLKSIVESSALPYLAEHGLELFDIEYVKESDNWYLRLFIDKEGGIDIEDCGRFSEFMSTQLDKLDPIENAYFLEVSSPGAERLLKTSQQIIKAIGKQVFVTTNEKIAGAKEFEGRLEQFDGQALILNVQGNLYVVPYDKINSARVVLTF